MGKIYIYIFSVGELRLLDLQRRITIIILISLLLALLKRNKFEDVRFSMGDKNIQAKLLEACFLAAAKHGSLVVVRALLSHPSCDLLARDEEGNTALHIAASRGHHQVVLELASKYSTAFKYASAGENNDGQTPLHLACSNGWIRCVDPLAIKFPSELNLRDSSGNVPLVTASLAGHNDIVSLLKQRYKVKFQSEDMKLAINEENDKKMKSEEIKTDVSKLPITKESSCLLAAAKHGSLVVVRALLSHPSCDLLARDEEGNTALHIAASRGHHELVLELASKYSTTELSAMKNIEGQTSLHLASSKGYVECIRMLVTRFPDELKVKNKYDNLPIHNAALFGQSNIIDCLCEEFGGDVDSLGHLSRTCLLLACSGGNIKLKRKLLMKYNCRRDALDEAGRLATSCAAYYGHTYLLEMLINEFKFFPASTVRTDGRNLLHQACAGRHCKTASILIRKYCMEPKVRDSHGYTALHCVCGPLFDTLESVGNFHSPEDVEPTVLVDMLVHLRCDPMDKDRIGRTALHHAVLSGQTQIVKQLVWKYKCRINSTDISGYTPLHYAAMGSYANATLVQVLVSKLGTNIKACYKQSQTLQAFHIRVALLNGYCKVVTILVEQFGCSPHIKGYNNRTTLHQACGGGHLELVKKLIDDYHCDPMARDDNGLTPLHIAAVSGKEQVVKRLVSNYKCPVECRDNSDHTPLHAAAQEGHMNVVQVLLLHLGADVHARNNQNKTPLHVAAQMGHSNVVTLLIEQFGCMPHAKGFIYRTPLHSASLGGHLELVEKLIDDYHCDPMARDDEGRTPLHIAAVSGKEQVVKRLVVKYKCPVECRDSDDNSLLHLAAQNGHLNVVEVLLSELGTDTQARNKDNTTALHLAALMGHSNVATVLVEQFGCSPHIKSDNNRTSLHHACGGGHLELVEKLIDHYHCDPMARDDNGLTPLHIAAGSGKEQVVKRLVSNYKCPVECRDSNDNSPLHLAAYNGHLNVVQVLISDLGADVHAHNKHNDTPLNVAARIGHSNVVTALVEQFGCNPNKNAFKNRVPLQDACGGGHLELVEKLIDDYHCDPMARDDEGLTPLHIAAVSGKEQVVKRLVVKYKCPVECRDNSDNTPLHLAAQEGHMNVVQVLLSELGADVHAHHKQNKTPLNVAARMGHSNVVTLLIEQFGCIPHTKGFNNRTPLHDACWGGHLELVEKLIDDYHCDPMAREDEGLTPLHFAALKGKEQVVKRLVSNYKCPVECRDNNDNTPLHFAAQEGHMNVVQVLLSHLGADIHARNKQNITPLHIAAQMGHNNVVTLLVEQFGCSQHAKGYNNRTPLHHACLGGHLELLEKLIDDYNCDPMARDDEGLTPLHIAALKGNKTIISKFVLKYNCSQYVSDNDGNTLLHSFELLSSGDMGYLKFLVDVIGTFPSIKNNKGKLPIDKESLELLVIPNMNNCVTYLSKHAVGEYRHAPPKLFVFDKRIVSTLNDNSKYSLLSSPYAQSCGLCYMDSIVNDLWVCQVGPEMQHTSVLQSSASGPILMAVVTVNLSIPIDQAMHVAFSQVALAKKLAYRDQSSSVPVRILLTGNSSPAKENIFDAVCQKIVDKHSIYFAQHFLSCASDRFPQKIFPIISDFINTSLGTVPNPDVPEITHGSIYLLKFLYQVYPGKSYAKFSQLAKQLENRRIMMEDHPEEIHACLRQLNQQGYLLTTGTSDHPHYIILNPLHMLHTLEEFSHKTSDPLATLGLYSKSLLSYVFPDCEFSMIESFLFKLGLSSDVSDRIVDLVMKQDLSTHVADKCFCIPQLATSARQLNCWTCQPETVFSCGLHLIALRKLNSFPPRLMNDVLLQTIRLITRNFLIEPHGLIDCTLWKGGIHWMVENVEVLVEFVDDVGGIVVMGRSDVCNMLKCVDMFVKVVDMVLEVKSVCCGDIVHKINVLDPNALESNTIPCGNEMLWCDVSTAARAIRTGRKNIQSTCRTQQFSVEKLNWLSRISLQGMSRSP